MISGSSHLPYVFNYFCSIFVSEIIYSINRSSRVHTSDIDPQWSNMDC